MTQLSGQDWWGAPWIDDRRGNAFEISILLRELQTVVQHPASRTQFELGTGSDFSFRTLSVSALLAEFAAGKGVPGSGSANALAAAVAACLAAAVATKTYNAGGTKYVHVKQTAADVERRTRRIGERLIELFEEDSAAFSPVIALRRDTGREVDVIIHDSSLRQEVAALKPATTIPLKIARLAADVGDLAITMLDSGYAAARGESYTALAHAVAAVDGAIYVAQLNIRTIRQRLKTLNDPELEADWIRIALRDITELRARWRTLRIREHRARRALHKETFGLERVQPEIRKKPARTRKRRTAGAR